ncbi:Ig-like domain-containing protein [Corynebacterium sp. HS2168-gen11]|uniref:Ig-like domain-containing protein n=1 Tax=Corynebacterium sp. HS2168-gen11 TaxID=2974027 RepID=UPI00216B399D|nr:hypothetical protein [Corynebacterium sp. HS2168-gen11]MCS4535338.1 hypothetical protein [Corynebacterium sp. HS2168-gen11]
MARLQKVLAAAVVPLLGVAALSAPMLPVAQAASAEISFQCAITTNGLGALKSQADSVQKSDSFRFTAAVEAPTEAIVGQPFNYVIKPGYVGLPNPFKVAGIASVTTKSMERARLSLKMPNNATVNDVSIAGGQAGIQVTNSGKTYSLSGGATTDGINANNESEITLATQDKGLVGSARAGKMGFEIPTITVSLTGNQVGTSVKPTLPIVANPSSKIYPAEESFFTMMIDAEAAVPILGTYQARALVRCSPLKADVFPAVRIVAAPKATVASLKISANPAEGQKGTESTFTITALDASGQPLAGHDISTKVGFKGSVLRTNDQGQVTISETPKHAGTLAVSASADGVTETLPYKVADNVARAETIEIVGPAELKPNQAGTFTATVQTKDGQPVANKAITFEIAGQSFAGTTNDKGMFEVTYTPTEAGTLSVVATTDLSSAEHQVNVVAPVDPGTVNPPQDGNDGKGENEVPPNNGDNQVPPPADTGASSAAGSSQADGKSHLWAVLAAIFGLLSAQGVAFLIAVINGLIPGIPGAFQCEQLSCLRKG